MSTLLWWVAQSRAVEPSRAAAFASATNGREVSVAGGGNQRRLAGRVAANAGTRDHHRQQSGDGQ